MVVLEFAVTFTTNLSVFSINTWGVGKIPFNRVVPVPSSWPLCISVIHFSYPQAIITISVQFSHSLMSNSLRPHGLQHARPPVYHQLPEFTQTHVHWVGDAIQPSQPLSSSCLQSFPASGFFQMSQLFASGGQSIGVSASTSVLPMNIQDWFPLGCTSWIYIDYC